MWTTVPSFDVGKITPSILGAASLAMESGKSSHFRQVPAAGGCFTAVKRRSRVVPEHFAECWLFHAEDDRRLAEFLTPLTMPRVSKCQEFQPSPVLRQTNRFTVFFPRFPSSSTLPRSGFGCSLTPQERQELADASSSVVIGSPSGRNDA